MNESENLRLYASMVPQMDAGIWTVEIEQELSLNKDAQRKAVNEEKIRVRRQILVPSAVFSLTEGMVVNRCPLPGTKAAVTDCVPHIILKGPFLPWIGRCRWKEKAVPSLGLLVLTEQELRENGCGTLHRMKVKDYLGGVGRDNGVFRPDYTDIPKEMAEQECSYIRIAGPLAKKVLPHMDELSYYAHCRQVYIGNKAEMGLDRDGLFSVVMSPRVPQYIPGQVQSYHTFLIVQDGLLREEGKDSPFQDFIVLDSWEFQVSGQTPYSFRRFCEDLTEKDADRMLLRLSGDIPDGAVKERVKEGFVPLLYHARTGDEGMCFYRSPLIPVSGKEIEKKEPFFTADAAMIYDAQSAVFDLSLACAWEAGRLSAVSDQVYVRQILALRKKAQQIADVLFSRMLSRAAESGKKDTLDRPEEFAQSARKELEQLGKEEWDGLLQGGKDAETLVMALNRTGWDTIGQGEGLMRLAGEASCITGEVMTETEVLVRAFLKENYMLLLPLLEEETAPLAAWLGKLLLLYPVPQDYLLPHPQLLPRESVRFFYLDENWQRAAFDGAVSLGLDSSRQADFNCVMERILYESTRKEMLAYRAALYGETVPGDDGGPKGGFMIRSHLVSSWPTLSLQAYDKEGKKLAILRMQHLAGETLLCILDGIPARIQVEEPGESLQMKILHKDYEVFRSDAHVLDLDKAGSGLLGQMAKRLGKKAEEIDVLTFVTELLTTGERTVFEKEGGK